MKLRVITTFRDKVDHKTVYKPGKQIEINDEQRARDLIDRGLAVEVAPRVSGSKAKKADGQTEQNESKKSQAKNEDE